MTSKKLLIIPIVLIVIAVGAVVLISAQKKDTTSATPSGSAQNPGKAAPKSTGFDKTQYSTTDPTSIWIVVNKQHPLQPKNYAPSDLVTPNLPLRVPGNESMEVRKVTSDALETMFAAAKTDGLAFMISSGYRSYSYQVNLYGGYVHSVGQAAADAQSARPGYSEHQTGLAADLEPVSRNCEVEQCFGETPEGKWLVANAYKYGFIIRYTADKVPITGYEYEPWHVRYVGVPLATEMHNTGVQTLEEFFGISGGQNY